MSATHESTQQTLHESEEESIALTPDSPASSSLSAHDDNASLKTELRPSSEWDRLNGWLELLTPLLHRPQDIPNWVTSLADLLESVYGADAVTLHSRAGSRNLTLATQCPTDVSSPPGAGLTGSLQAPLKNSKQVSTGLPSASPPALTLRLDAPVEGSLTVSRSKPPFTEAETQAARSIEAFVNGLLRLHRPAEAVSASHQEAEADFKTLLRQLGMALQAGAELEATLQTVADLSTQIVHAGSAVIRLMDERGHLVVRALSGDEEIHSLKEISFAPDVGIIGQVVRDRQPRIVNDFDPSDHPFTEAVRKAGIRSVLCVPILAASRQYALGTLTLHNKIDREPFDEEDQALLMTFAEQAATAVEKAVLRERQEEAAQEAGILHEVASATASLHLSSVLAVAGEKVMEVSGVDQCCLFLYDSERSLLKREENCPHHSWCPLDPDRARIPLPQDDPLYRLLRKGVPVDLPDFNIASPAQQKILGLLPGGFHILVPLLEHRHLVGSIILTPREGASPLSDRQCRILISVGRQIASAIQNARLYEEADQRVRELSALQRISQALASTLETKEMLETVLKEVVEVLDGASGSLMLFSTTRNTLRVEASHGLPARLSRRVIKLGEGVAGWVAMRRESLLVGNLKHDPRFKLLVQRPDIRSAMVVPLMSKHRLIGVLSVSTGREDQPYTPQDLKLMETMAASIAVAIENARDYDQEKNIAQIARKGLLPDLPLVIPGLDIGEKYRPAKEVGGDYYAVFPVGKDRIGILVSDVSGKSVYAAMHAAMGKHFIRALSHRCDDPAEVLRHANDLLARETPPEIFITAFFGILDVNTGRLVYSNAGHVPPLVVRRDHCCEELNPTGMLLGLWEGNEISRCETTLEPGELFICFTDGVTEARREGQLFGEDRLKSVIQKHCQESAQKVVDAVYRRTVAFSGKKVDDDLAMLAIKRVAG